MKTSPNLLACCVLLSAGMTQAGDFDAASFHGENCTACHGTDVYTRTNRRVGSLQALDAQVARCDANLGIGLFPDDQARLVDYLNTNFYGFGN